MTISTFWTLSSWILFGLGSAYPEYAKIATIQYPNIFGFLAMYWLIGNYVCGFACLYRASRVESVMEYFDLDKSLKYYFARHIYGLYRRIE
jgi:hypothetical protein